MRKRTLAPLPPFEPDVEHEAEADADVDADRPPPSLAEVAEGRKEPAARERTVSSSAAWYASSMAAASASE